MDRAGHRILVGVDGTTPSLRAGAFAAGVARRQGATLIVLFVKTLPGFANATTLPAVIEGMDAAERDLRAAVMERAGELDTPVEFVSTSGDPVVEIVRTADERQVDQIIVGASAAPRHRYVGSVATRLVRKGRWPVTVVP